MRLTTALAILLPALLASCAIPVDYHGAQHVAEVDHLVAMRQDYRAPAPPDPNRSIQAENCTEPMVPVSGNLWCE